MKRIASAIASIGIPVIAWFATNGDENAGNLIKFIAGGTLVASSLYVLAFMVGCKSDDKSKTPPFWRWFSQASSAFTAFLLAWHGWLWTAAVFALWWVVYGVEFVEEDKQASKKATKD